MLYRATIILGSECFCRVQRKLKASLCTACRRQDPRTGLSPTLLPKTGYGWARVFTSQRAGKNSTGFLLKVVGMHTDKNAFKGACFLQWADFRDPCTDMPRSFSLACPGCTRKCSCKMNIWDGIHHPSLILITCRQHTCGSDQVHADHGISGQLAPHSLRARHPAGVCFTPKTSC